MGNKETDVLQVPTFGEIANTAIKGGHEWSQGNDAVKSDNVNTGNSTSQVNEGTHSNEGENNNTVSYKEGTAGLNSQIDTIDKWMARVKEPETEEERIKRERKEKSKRVISALSDGLSALGNLFFTTKYAPDMYEPQNSLMAATNAQIEKARAEREKNEEAYYNLAMKRGQLEHEREKTTREIEAQAEAQLLAREKHHWLAVLQPYIQREHAGKANKSESEAETAAVEARFAPDMQQAKLNTENARTDAQTASATASRASANASNAAAARSRAEAEAINQFSAWDENGNEHKFKTKAAAKAYAIQHGTYQEVDIEETSETNSEVNGYSITSKKKKSGNAAKPSPTGKPSPTA